MGTLGPRGVASWTVGVVVLLHVLPFATRPALIGGDEPHYALIAHSLATDRDVELGDEYAAVAAGSRVAGRSQAGKELEPHVLERNGRELPGHPLGLPALAAPLLALQELVVPGASPDLVLAFLTLAVTFAGLVAGCRLLGTYLGAEREGVALGLMLYFGSPLWYYSRTFFTEPYTWAWAVLGVAALARGRPVLAGVLLGLSLAMKETALLLVAPVLLTSWGLRGARSAALASLGPVGVGVLWVAKNLVLMGEPFATFQPFQYGSLAEGVAGLLLDPEDGLLWFAPLSFVAMAGWLRPPRGRRDAWLAAASLLAFVSYLLVAGAWIEWRGGSSYATRLILPALPALAIPAAALWRGVERRLRPIVFGVPFALGFAVNLAAAVNPVPALWGRTVWAQVAERPVAFSVGLLLAAVSMARFFQAPGHPDRTEAHRRP